MAYVATIASAQIAVTYSARNTGTLDFGTAASVAGNGDVAWTDPNNAKVAETPTPLYSTCILAKGGTKKSYYLQMSNLGLSISEHRKILGISVTVKRYAGAASTIKDILCKLIKADGTFGSTNKADTSNYWPNSATEKTYGSDTDTWDETPTGADLMDADFGFIIQIQNYSAAINVTSYIDWIKMTIHFTDGGRITVTKTMGVD
jgi:hypothetical protein